MNIDFCLIEKMKEKVLQIYKDSKNIKEINIKNKEGNLLQQLIYIWKRILLD